MIRIVLAVAGVAVGLFLAATPVAAQTTDQRQACQALADRVNAQLAAGQFDPLVDVFNATSVSRPCGTAYQNDLLDAISRLAIHTIATGLDAGQTVQAYEATLSRFETYPDGVCAHTPAPGRLEAARFPWPIYYYLGRLRQAQGDPCRAAYNYEQALIVSEDLSATPDNWVPDQSLAAEISHRYQESLLLAGGYIVNQSTRDAVVSVLSQPVLRSGLVQVRVAVPVEFPYDSVEFTDRGRRAAERLVDILTEAGTPEPFTIIGHTDERGSAAYNRELSQRRAEQLRDVVVASGYPRHLITVEARGEACPYMPSDPGLYDPTTEEGREQLWQMDRRAEIVWTNRPSPPGDPQCRN